MFEFLAQIGILIHICVCEATQTPNQQARSNPDPVQTRDEHEDGVVVLIGMKTARFDWKRRFHMCVIVLSQRKKLCRDLFVFSI